MRRIAVILLIAVAGAAPATSLAQNVGQATRVHSGSVQQSGTQVARLSTGDAIVWQARLGTDGTGSTEVTFADGTRLSMGPESDVVVDDFVYAPGASQQRMAVNLTKGFLRMISGDIRKDDVRIATPVAALGIRGTDFTLDVNVPDLLRIWLEEGAIFVVPADTGLVFEYAAPARVDCTRSACRLIAQTPVPRAFAAAPAEEPMTTATSRMAAAAARVATAGIRRCRMIQGRVPIGCRTVGEWKKTDWCTAWRLAGMTSQARSRHQHRVNRRLA